MRAIAIAFVIGYHADVSFMSGGVVGVDIFFVVSGYLITSLLIRELDQSGRINLIQFYARRARRLLPAATLVVLTVCLVEAVLASPFIQYRVLKDAMATMVYSSNIYFSNERRSYFFPASPPSPLLHTWSLAVEEQFYIVWPILLLLLARIRASARLKVLFLAAITAVSMAVFFLLLMRFSESAAYFLAPARAWEFGAGGLASFVSKATLNRNRYLCSCAGIAGLLTLMYSAAFIRVSASFPSNMLAVVVAATVAILLSGAGAPNSLTANLLKSPPLQFVGAISYSLYLWHWPVLTIARNVSSSNSPALRAGCTIVSVLLATITYALVENPIRRNIKFISKPKLTLGMAVVSIMICMLGFAGWRAVLIHSKQYRKFQQAFEDKPSFDAFHCKGDNLLQVCTLDGPSDPAFTMVLLGDSHAAQWLQPLKEIAQTKLWKLVTMIQPCSPIPIISGVVENPQQNGLCDQWRAFALEKIREMHPDMVILSSSSRYPRPDNTPGFIDTSEWEKRSYETFLALSEAATSVRFIRDTPDFDYDPVTCLAQQEWNGRADCSSPPRSRALNTGIYEAEVRAGAKIGNLRFIDMSDAIFHGDRLEPERDGVILFRDGDHMTQRFAGCLAGELQRQLLAGSSYDKTRP